MQKQCYISGNCSGLQCHMGMSADWCLRKNTDYLYFSVLYIYAILFVLFWFDWKYQFTMQLFSIICNVNSFKIHHIMILHATKSWNQANLSWVGCITWNVFAVLWAPYTYLLILTGYLRFDQVSFHLNLNLTVLVFRSSGTIMTFQGRKVLGTKHYLTDYFHNNPIPKLCKLTKWFFVCQISFISGGNSEFRELGKCVCVGGVTIPKVNATKMAKFWFFGEYQKYS